MWEIFYFLSKISSLQWQVKDQRVYWHYATFFWSFKSESPSLVFSRNKGCCQQRDPFHVVWAWRVTPLSNFDFGTMWLFWSSKKVSQCHCASCDLVSYRHFCSEMSYFSNLRLPPFRLYRWTFYNLFQVFHIFLELDSKWAPLGFKSYLPGIFRRFPCFSFNFSSCSSFWIFIKLF